jgi:hypothetical protein
MVETGVAGPQQNFHPATDSGIKKIKISHAAPG